MSRLDRTAISVILLASALLALLVFGYGLAPVEVTCQSQSIGPYGALRFEFSRPVDPASVAALFQAQPELAGRWTWEDERTAVWYSLTPLKTGEVLSFTFMDGRAGQNREELSGSPNWQARVRSPELIYLSTANNNRDLFRIDPLQPDEPLQITDTCGRLYDFRVAPDGEHVLYSAVNDQKGIDLWSASRDGNQRQMLLNCGADRCTLANQSPAAALVAYTRERAPLTSGSPPGAPRPWILDLETNQTWALYAQADHIGYGPVWSPDGQWLAVWEGVSGGIDVVRYETGESFFLPSFSGDTGSWSPDNQFLDYWDVTHDGLYLNIWLRADLKTGQVTTIANGALDGSQYSYKNPRWNPTGSHLVVSVQPDSSVPDAQLWLVTPGGQQAGVISSDPDRLLTNYSWNPDGDWLAFDVILLGSSVTGQTIAVWNLNADEQISQVASQANFVTWLP